MMVTRYWPCALVISLLLGCAAAPPPAATPTQRSASASGAPAAEPSRPADQTAYLHVALAHVHAQAGQIADAVAELRKAIDRDPKTASLWILLARWLGRLNAHDEAVAAAKQALALDPASGKILAQGRLKGAVDNFFASPVAADDKIFMVSESGKVAVLKPDGSLEVLVVNDLDDLCYATPAIADGRLYVRARNTLYCFGRAAAARER